VHSLAWTEAAWSKAAWSKAGDVDEDARTSGGWRFFAPPSNLSLAVDMNLRDRLLRRDPRGAWDATHAAMSATAGVTAFPALLYEWAPRRNGAFRAAAQPTRRTLVRGLLQAPQSAKDSASGQPPLACLRALTVGLLVS